MREEDKRISQDKSKDSFFKKRWVKLGVYTTSAAIILTGVLWYQSNFSNNIEQSEYTANDIPGKKRSEQPAVEVNQNIENLIMPVVNENDIVIKTGFYENDSNKEKQEAALVFYNNTYYPSKGLDIASKDGKEFNVVVSLSGTVTKVMEDSVLGNVIEIEHDKGIITQYHSVKDYQVKVGDQVRQGEIIATSGTSLFNEGAGNHVHFEIRKDNVPLNPLEYFNRSLSTLHDVQITDEKTPTEVDG